MRLTPFAAAEAFCTLQVQPYLSPLARPDLCASRRPRRWPHAIQRIRLRASRNRLMSC